MHDGRPVAERRGRVDGGLLLGDGERLARQRRLVDLEQSCGDDARVGRHAVARRQREQVAGHDVGCGDVLETPVADDRGVVGQHRVERLDRPGRAPLLQEPDRGVDGDHGEHDEAVDVVAQGDRDDARDEQHHDQRAAELADEHPDRGLTPARVDDVGADRAQTALGLGSVEAAQSHPEPRTGLARGGGMPGDDGRRGGGARRVHARRRYGGLPLPPSADGPARGP